MTVCEECGSDKVQTVMWVFINSEEIGDLANSQSQDDQDNWCSDCSEHCSLIEKKQKKDD